MYTMYTFDKIKRGDGRAEHKRYEGSNQNNERDNEPRLLSKNGVGLR